MTAIEPPLPSGAAPGERAVHAPVAVSAAHSPADFALPPEAAELIREAVPENTSRAYESRWRSFEAWCGYQGRVPLPATAQTVAAYLTHLATGRGLKATTVDAHLTAIRTVHRASGEAPPDGLAARKIVVAAGRREARRDGRYGPRKAIPVLAADLPAITAVCDPRSAAGPRDRALILLGFALLARRSELAALNISDIVLAEGEGLEVTIRSSKTDPSARGVIRRIHYAANPDVCPVRAVLVWLEFLAGRGITTGPLFTCIDRWGNVGTGAGGRYRSEESRDARLRPQAVGDIIAAACTRAGLGGPPDGAAQETGVIQGTDASQESGDPQGTGGSRKTSATRGTGASRKNGDPQETSASRGTGDPQGTGGSRKTSATQGTGASQKNGDAQRTSGPRRNGDSRGYSGHSVRRGGATSMLRAGADPLNVSRHGRWADGSRAFAGYVEEATGFGEANPTRGLL